MKNTYFISGTDTDVGKTLIAAAFLRAATQQGLKAFALKPVAAGCEVHQGALRNADALSLMANSNVELPYAQVNPCALAAAKAPHIAAAEEGRRINLDQIEGIVRGALMSPADLRLVEGAGGWRIPITPSQQLANIPINLKMPVILVVGMRLGCLNHALLSAEAIASDGLPLAGWVANCIDAQMPSQQDNINTLRHCLNAPYLGTVPNLPEASPQNAAKYLDLRPLIASI